MTVSARPAIASKYASNDSFDENEDRLYVKKSDIYTSDEDSDDYTKYITAPPDSEPAGGNPRALPVKWSARLLLDINLVL